MNRKKWGAVGGAAVAALTAGAILLGKPGGCHGNSCKPTPTPPPVTATATRTVTPTPAPTAAPTPIPLSAYEHPRWAAANPGRIDVPVIDKSSNAKIHADVVQAMKNINDVQPYLRLWLEPGDPTAGALNCNGGFVEGYILVCAQGNLAGGVYGSTYVVSMGADNYNSYVTVAIATIDPGRMIPNGNTTIHEILHAVGGQGGNWDPPRQPFYEPLQPSFFFNYGVTCLLAGDIQMLNAKYGNPGGVPDIWYKHLPSPSANATIPTGSGCPLQ